MNNKIKQWNELSAIEKIMKVRGSGLRDDIYEQAETELAALRAERDRLREALENLLRRIDEHFETTSGDWKEQEDAREALKGGE